jgi:membrane protease YdiL (CAAX protease family)
MVHQQLKSTRKVFIYGIALCVALLFNSLVIPAVIYSKMSHSNSNLAVTIFLSRLLLWVCLLIVLTYSTKIEGHSILLFKEVKYPVGFYILSVVSLIVILFAMAGVLGVMLKLSGLYSEKNTTFLRLLQMFNNNKWLMIFTALTAGVVEELLFRGYLFSRLQFIFNNSYLAVIISSLLFGLIHFGYGTVQNVVIPTFIGFAFALFYNRYKSIMVLIIAHFLYDLILILIALHYYFPK